jgi:hypothetical protein
MVVNQSLAERNGLWQKSQIIGRRPCDICPWDFGQIPSAQATTLLRTGRPILDHLELHCFELQSP